MENVSNAFEKSVKNWFLELGPQTFVPLCTDEIGRFFNSNPIDSEFLKNKIKFANIDPDFKRLINSESKKDRIIISEVPAKETFFHVCKIYSLCESIIYLSTDYDSTYFDKAIEYSKSCSDIFFVIECTAKLEEFLKKSWSEFKEIVEHRPNVKLAIVCEEPNGQMFLP